MTRAYRARLESLRAVDDGVGRIVKALKKVREYENTLIVFTSDNGFLAGEHRIGMRKIHPYEESIRVPLVLRGPGIPRGKKVTTPVSNVDLAPTVLAAGRAKPRVVKLDGSPLGPLAKAKAADRDMLIETGPKRSKEAWYAAIRTSQYIYVKHSTGEEELYDLLADPYQLTSLHKNPLLLPTKLALAKRLQKLRKCRASGCP